MSNQKRKLTPKAYAFIGVLLVLLSLAAFFVISPMLSGESGSQIVDNEEVVEFVVVTWPGYSAGQYVNGGFDVNPDSKFTTECGLNVRFKVMDDFAASREYFKNRKGPTFMWATIDALPTEIADLASEDPRVFLQADWSRGGDAVVAKVSNFSELRGKKIGYAPYTPSHTYLLWLLEANDMDLNSIKSVEFPSAIDAADAYKNGSVDAAVVWSPDDQICVSSVPRTVVVSSTKTATHIIADVFIGKGGWIDSHKEEAQCLYETWMEGAAMLNNSEEARNEVVQMLANEFTLSMDEARQSIQRVRWTNHGDNLNFFGIDRSYNGITGRYLYDRMADKYSEIGAAPANVPMWRKIANTEMVGEVSLLGSHHESEQKKTYIVDEADVEAVAMSTKSISVEFPTGSNGLTNDSKNIIDHDLIPLLNGFSNKVRVEGNTDNTGARALNLTLSRGRAESVVDYLVLVHNFPRDRFIVVGNGPDNPIAPNTTAAGRKKNRRTSFNFIN